MRLMKRSRNSMLLNENVHASKYVEAITRTVVNTRKLVRSSNRMPGSELELEQLNALEILALN